jgi:hypothetical protein
MRQIAQRDAMSTIATRARPPCVIAGTGSLRRIRPGVGYQSAPRAVREPSAGAKGKTVEAADQRGCTAIFATGV